MKEEFYTITQNREIAPGVFRMMLYGDTSPIFSPGQFVNIQIDGCFLRRPISICDWNEHTLTIIYRVVGKGTEILSKEEPGKRLNLLIALGNGFDSSKSGETPLLIGGGVGIPPLYGLCRQLLSEGKKVAVILGFNRQSEIFYEEEFRGLGATVLVTTMDGSAGIKGTVTAAMEGLSYSYFYTCGPMPMFRAIESAAKTGGQFSFEERMGCGFGACMGCTCQTKNGPKRICTEGPVLEREEIEW